MLYFVNILLKPIEIFRYDCTMMTACLAWIPWILPVLFYCKKRKNSTILTFRG